MNVTCSAANLCTTTLNSSCVYYTGADLIYTGILTNDNLTVALEKINAKIEDSDLGYIFRNGITQAIPGDPVKLGGVLIENTTITSSGFSFTITGGLTVGSVATIGGLSTQFLKADGSLDNTTYQVAGNYITALTGDGTASGPGSATFTLATVNYVPGTYGDSVTVPIVTVNSKGLVTNITDTAINLPPVLASFSGDVTGIGNINAPITLTLNTVNSNTYGSNTFLKFAVNAKGLVTSATPVTAVTITGVLGYTPVPNTRTLTINGVSHDLTANRSWTVGDLLSSGSYSNPTWLTSLAWSKISGTPTSLAGYGITDPVVLTSGSYANPAWITSLAWSKITGAPPYTSAITSLNGLTASVQTFVNDTNVTITSTGTTHTLGWTGTLADSRIASASTWNAKQNALSGTGFVKISGTTISYDNTTYFPYPTGTTSQYLRGDGSLATFPTFPTITPSALTKTDDTNVTLTLGGTPNTALLEAVSLTLGWTGTLADSRIASASTWNSKQNALSGTGIVKSTAGTISYLTDNTANWDTAYSNRITSLTTTGTGAATLIANVLNIPIPPSAIFTSLTTTGSSGSSTLISGVLNVPTYTLSGLGGQPQLNGTGFVKASGTTISYDNSTYTPTSRNLTINGVTYDLSADRSWTISAGTGTVTSVGLSMPSAFTVTNSPVISSGTLTVTAAGTAAQYIRGDGTLASFPTTGGGGSSVSYYLNGSVNQGTFSGNTYYQLSKTPITTSPGTDFTISSNGIIARFITDPGDPGLLNIPGGNFNIEFFFNSSSSGGTPTFYVNIYKYNGTTFTLLGSNSTAPEGITNGTIIDSYFTSVSVPTSSLTLTDRLAVEVYVNNSGRTITLHTEDSHLCEIITTFSTGLNALNGLTAQVQYFATGTSGSDFNISSVSDTHTFNLPVASGTNTGKLSSTDYTTFNNKASKGFAVAMAAAL